MQTYQSQCYPPHTNFTLANRSLSSVEGTLTILYLVEISLAFVFSVPRQTIGVKTHRVTHSLPKFCRMGQRVPAYRVGYRLQRKTAQAMNESDLAQSVRRSA